MSVKSIIENQGEGAGSLIGIFKSVVPRNLGKITYF
jgi:hypothetical protein